MPLYEYTCRDCGTQFEALRSMKEADAPIECKHCRKDNVKRNLSLCFAHSGSQAAAGTGGGCGGCSGGSCGSCSHH